MPNRRPSNTISRPALTWSLFFYLSGDAAGGPRLALDDIALKGQRPLSFHPQSSAWYGVLRSEHLLRIGRRRPPGSWLRALNLFRSTTCPAAGSHHETSRDMCGIRHVYCDEAARDPRHSPTATKHAGHCRVMRSRRQ
jgi:hypothetical protein